MGMLFVVPTYEAYPDHTVVVIGPEERTAELRIPNGYNPDNGLLPLVVALHGYSEDPEYITSYFETLDSVDENGHLLLTPKGTENQDGYWFWNGTDACCDFYDQKPDDVGWLTGLIDEAVNDHGADPERVMLIGHSNGGFMSHRMACDAGEYLHTIVNFAGSTFSDFDECTEMGYPNIINVHGTDDDVIYYNGGFTYTGSYPSAPQSTSFWADRSGCEEETTFIRELNLVNEDDVKDTEDLEYLSCEKGNRVTLWKINGQGHMPYFYDASLINASFEWAFVELPNGKTIVKNDAPEAENYTLIYELEIPNGANFNSNGINYTEDYSDTVNYTFSRVAYHLELEQEDEERVFVFVSMPSLTLSVEEIGVPHIGAGFTYQQLVEDLHIESNHPELSNLGIIDTGSIEFWPGNYGTWNTIAVPGASNDLYDAGDTAVEGSGYGSMQIHDYESDQTLFAYNSWGNGGEDDLGIGNNSNTDGHPDWTFEANTPNYILKTLRVLIQPGPTPDGLSVNLSSPEPHQIVQRQEDNIGTIPISGTMNIACDFIEARVVPIEMFSDNSIESDWITIVESEKSTGSTFFGLMEVEAGWYDLEIRISNNGSLVDNFTVSPIGVGEVFITAGQSNSANHGDPVLSPSDPRVSAWGDESGWQFATDPQPIATGGGGTPWPVLGDMLVERYNVPVGFISVGWGGTAVSQWTPEGGLFDRIILALDEVGFMGVRAVLWHQGESDMVGGTSTEDYIDTLNEVITASRIEAGWQLPWIVARASYIPGYDDENLERIVSAQQAVIDSDPYTYEGPYTDNLTGEEWRWDTVHFSEAGLIEHATRWDISIANAMLEFFVWDEDGNETITVNHVVLVDTPPHPEWSWNYSYQIEVNDLHMNVDYTAVILIKKVGDDEWGGLDWWWDDIERDGDQYNFTFSLQRGCFHINANLYESGALNTDEGNATILAFEHLNFTVGNGTCVNGVYSEDMIEIDDSDNDGVEDVNDRCPDTVEGAEVDEDGCAASCCTIDEGDERRWIPGFGIFTTLIAIALVIRKFKRRD